MFMNKLVKLFSTRVSGRMAGFLFICISVASCGGGQTSSDSNLLSRGDTPNQASPSPEPSTSPDPSVEPSPAPSPSSSPVVTASPTPTTTPVVTPTPSSTPDPDATPTPTPTPTPVVLSKPQLSVSITASGLNVNWGQNTAYRYRVLYYLDDIHVGDTLTNSVSSHVLPVNDFGTYTVIVEAYDTLGNSLFSDPAVVEVSP